MEGAYTSVHVYVADMSPPCAAVATRPGDDSLHTLQLVQMALLACQQL
jgi:hypothetical protein